MTLAARLHVWSSERFPAVNAVLIAVLALAAVLSGRALTTDGHLALHAQDLAAFAALWSWFLLLRVLDEHKDHDRDAMQHPERALQRGVITLDHLKLVGVTAIVVQLAVALAMPALVVAAWALTMAWTLLMAREFFIAWLPEAPLLYGVSHMLAMPLAFLWMAQIGAGGEQLGAPVLWFALAGFCIGAAMEIGRKLAREDSYAVHLGARGARVAVAVLLATSGAAAGALLQALGELSVLATASLALAVAPGAVAALRADDPDIGVGVSVLLLLIAVAATLAMGRGVTL